MITISMRDGETSHFLDQPGFANAGISAYEQSLSLAAFNAGFEHPPELCQFGLTSYHRPADRLRRGFRSR